MLRIYTYVVWNLETKRERCSSCKSFHRYLETADFLVAVQQLFAKGSIRILELCCSRGVRDGFLAKSLLEFLDTHCLSRAEDLLRQPIAQFPVF
jgi:hypothetical protein